MIIVGIHDGHNSSAALLRDGSIVAAAQEERFTRLKNQGGFPRQALAEVLRLANARFEDVDLFSAANVHEPTEHDWTREAILQRWETGRRGRLRRMLKAWPPALKIRQRQLRRGRQEALKRAGLPPERTRCVDHHTAHASAAYFGGGLSRGDSLVLTADGLGDYASATMHVGRDGHLSRAAEVSDEHSLGSLYQIVTFLLGMVPLEHEHKVMGLAPYAPASRPEVQRIRKRFQDLFEFVGAGTSWRCTNGLRIGPETVPFIEGLVRRERFDHIAAGLQSFLEDFLAQWVRNCVQATGIRRLAIGGGVFMNVKANQRILGLPEVESLFVMPSASDETNSIGAAYHSLAETGGAASAAPLGPLYLGPDVVEQDALAALKEMPAGSGTQWRRMERPAHDVAALIARGEIVARAAGRMEFGSRALGNRSILADPSRPDHVRTINAMIKNRDFWMPFAPSVTTKDLERFLERPKGVRVPYMALALDAHRENVGAIAASVHPADFTARPQEVDRDWNPAYHDLLEAFAKESGHAVLLNTSFNVHGEPIVCSARDALDVFHRSGLRFLQLGPLLVWKDSAGAPPAPGRPTTEGRSARRASPAARQPKARAT